MNVRDVSLTLAELLLRAHLPADEETASPSARKRAVNKPYSITISREVGAQGTTIATEVGKRLDWPVYDQEIIHKIATEMKQPSSHVRGVDEKHFTWLENCLSNLVDEYHVNPSVYLKFLIGTIRGLGLIGKCVIVGRGSSFILPPETTLRVRLVADLPDRIMTVGRLQAVSDREAAKYIEKTQQERVEFVSRSFGKDPRDPHFYDLVLNVSRLSVEECAQVIVDTLRVFEERRAVGALKEVLASV